MVVFGGDQVIADNYNRLLYADGKGLLPARGRAERGRRREEGVGVRLQPAGLPAPDREPIRGRADPVTAGLTRAMTWQFHKLKLPEDSTAQVALAFDNGDPAVIEAPRHRGKVIQVATSADAGWTTWPLHPSYPPVMEQIVLQAASGRLAERNVRVGQPLDQALPAAGASAAGRRWSMPEGQPVAAKLKAAGGVSQLHFEETELSGAYQVRIGPPLALETAFAANPDPAESDPAKLDRAAGASGFPAGTSPT